PEDGRLLFYALEVLRVRLHVPAVWHGEALLGIAFSRNLEGNGDGRSRTLDFEHVPARLRIERDPHDGGPARRFAHHHDAPPLVADRGPLRAIERNDGNAAGHGRSLRQRRRFNASRGKREKEHQGGRHARPPEPSADHEPLSLCTAVTSASALPRAKRAWIA